MFLVSGAPSGADVDPVGPTQPGSPLSCTHPQGLVRPLLLGVIIIVIIVAAAEVAGEVGEEQENQQYTYSQ